MRERIVGIIRAAIDRENELRDTPIDVSAGEETQLYGLNGQLDSMGLVSLVVDVEGEIERQLNVSVTLVSDRAMSARRSPFATIGSLADYALSLASEVAGV
jgi:acyl carrier protein